MGKLGGHLMQFGYLAGHLAWCGWLVQDEECEVVEWGETLWGLSSLNESFVPCV